MEFCHNLVLAVTEMNGSCNSSTIVQTSFKNVMAWLQEIDEYASDGDASANVQKLLVGNKYDLAYLRAVEKEDAQVSVD